MCSLFLLEIEHAQFVHCICRQSNHLAGVDMLRAVRVLTGGKVADSLKPAFADHEAHDVLLEKCSYGWIAFCPVHMTGSRAHQEFWSHSFAKQRMQLSHGVDEWHL
eukprot:gnl/TRDRNA2_/TRDRNA2_165720_c0_seq1.p1 gnl/TRDRNA2_/TRDRNA2_165720_c0~~gnl/TRDRNA2_/TRDRNA2_165720_c0_seq1.p1  ORF type:complete len:106 (-),score=6.50 gnl/TRDRNA2_/TRDRNA2_165720_c0_seq1:264-581(-)